jgi:RNA polymerase sigma factor (TIGR02999 family)
MNHPERKLPPARSRPFQKRGILGPFGASVSRPFSGHLHAGPERRSRRDPIWYRFKPAAPGRMSVNVGDEKGGPQKEEESKKLAEMLPLVYEELRLLAGGYLRQERPEHTLQRTALVHEAYLRLAAQPQLNWENPRHLLAIFARLMRQTLINHAVARSRAKRGGSDPTAQILEFYERHEIDVTAVDEALQELEQLDPRQARIVELRFFAGLTIEEIGRLLQISPATVKREWSVAKLWLRKALESK